MKRKHNHTLKDYEKFKRGINVVWAEDSKYNCLSFDIPYEMAANLSVGDELLFNNYDDDVALWLLNLDEEQKKYDLEDLRLTITKKIWTSRGITFYAYSDIPLERYEVEENGRRYDQ